VNADRDDFYGRVHGVFEAARRNAPSVILIDDADVIFESGRHGLYRYLLTMLDGLESASCERVCVMMTSMNARALPSALLRSGRVELWLHTRLPDEAARAVILREKLCVLPAPVNGADVDRLARAGHGLSGADLKAVVYEGKLLYARALVRGRAMTAVEDYFLKAIRTCRENRRNAGRMSSKSGEAVR
jgi:ATP-dependent 26S proteasome regulatory subunit